jgi:hypothetical protein
VDSLPFPRFRGPVVSAARGEFLFLKVLADNNAAAVANCEDPTGRAVAENVRLRVAIHDSSDSARHVVRGWVSANNAVPRWVTDAVVIRTRAGTALVLDSQLSGIYQRVPSNAPTVITKDVLEHAGQSLGTEGNVGSCWENRVYIVLTFRQRDGE